MSVPSAAILVIGDEILSGKTDDLNARFLTGQLRELGVLLRRIHFIPDIIEEVANEVRALSAQVDYLFTSGGVGPTHDDVTISGIAQAFDVGVVRHPNLEGRIRKHFGEDAEESRLAMANVPDGAQLIEVPDLRWPILLCRNVYILPGVPELFERKFLAIRERFRVEPFYLRTVLTLEDEFDITNRLNEVVEQFPQVAIGSYPNFATEDFKVKLTLESKDAEALDAAMKGLLDRLDQLRIVKAD